MKIRNLAFCGVMASILGMGASYADTIIASKAYVDAQVQPKQDVSNIETETYTDSTNKTSTTKYPSMATLKDAYDTLNTAISSVDVSAAVDDGNGTQTALQLTSDDETAPSTRAVIDTATTTKLTTVSDGVATMGAGDDNHFATTKAIADTFKDLDHKTQTDGTGTKPVIAVTQTDGQVTVQSGTINGTGIANSSITTNHIVDGTITADDLASGAVTSDKILNETIMNADVNTNANVAYPKMNSGLPSINVGGATDYSASCTKGSPCVLSFFVENGRLNYEWTNMDTEGLEGVPSTGDVAGKTIAS